MNSVGVVTARDHITIKNTPDDVWNTINDFVKLPIEKARQKYDLGDDVRDWKVSFAQNDITDSGPDKKQVVPIAYRPFENRFTYYTGRSRGFLCMPRPEVMRHMLVGENLGIAIGRAGQVIGRPIWDIVYCTQCITEFNFFRRGGNNLFPLYLYPLRESLILLTITGLRQGWAYSQSCKGLC